MEGGALRAGDRRQGTRDDALGQPPGVGDVPQVAGRRAQRVHGGRRDGGRPRRRVRSGRPRAVAHGPPGLADTVHLREGPRPLADLGEPVPDALRLFTGQRGASARDGAVLGGPGARSGDAGVRPGSDGVPGVIDVAAEAVDQVDQLVELVSDVHLVTFLVRRRGPAHPAGRPAERRRPGPFPRRSIAAHDRVPGPPPPGG